MKPRIYLIDAHAYLHRAYHALPPLNNSRGEPVGALYGFARMLLQLLRKEKPDYVAVCFDHPSPTFRHKAYAAYKATRKETDPDLKIQLAKASETAAAMGFSCVEMAGYEADDLMATLAHRAVKDGIEAVLVTGDKDALQLVGPSVRVLKDVAGGVWIDKPEVQAKLGIGPESVVDYLAIVGDTSDNVPGIKGIGPVGAVKLLKKYGGLSEVFAAAKAGDPEIPPKTLTLLRQSEPQAKTALDLLKLECEVPIKVQPRDCKYPAPQPERLREVFGRLEFGSLIKEILGEADSAGSAGVAVNSNGSGFSAVALVEKSWDSLCRELALSERVGFAALPNQADLVDGSRAHLALALEDGRVCFLGQAQVKAAHAEIANIFSGKARKSCWDLKSSMAALEILHLPVPAPCFDAMLAEYCLNPVRPKPDPKTEKGDWKSPLSRRIEKALHSLELEKKMGGAGVLNLYNEVERPLVPVLYGMEKIGIAVDQERLRRLSDEFSSDIRRIQGKIDALAGSALNPNSPKQLGEVLYDKLQLPVLHKTAKGGRSTDEECLQELSKLNPLPGQILEYRELSKLKSTYIDTLLELADAEGRVHTRFDQAGTETGRLSSLHPNLQNVPVRSEAGLKIRSVFVAPKGQVLVSADYSQIDLRVLAHVSQDKTLIEAFEKNVDAHTSTACDIFGVSPAEVDAEMRRRAKAVNFGLVYGQTPFGLANVLGIPQKEAADIINRYFALHQGVAEWFEKDLQEARRTGLVRTFLGRLRRLPELLAKNTALRQFAERAARNTPIQGGSADIIKLAMLKVARELADGKFSARMLLQIHDELLFEVPNGELKAFVPWVKKTMENAAQLSVPLIVEVKAGDNWRDMEKTG
jgi:DNA polymerase-1